MTTKILMLNPDPVFNSRVLETLDTIAGVEVRVVRTQAEMAAILLAESFDLLVFDGPEEESWELATTFRHHFPSLDIACLVETPLDRSAREMASIQKVNTFSRNQPVGWLRWRLCRIISEASEGAQESSTPEVTLCHSLTGDLAVFPASDLLQMSCLTRGSGRFTFKSARGVGEIYICEGDIKHASFDGLTGESAIAEIFRWQDGRFYFEDGILSAANTVTRPWSHVIVECARQRDETFGLKTA